MSEVLRNEPLLKVDRGDNPHELMVVSCQNCREKTHGFRGSLSDRGWKCAESDHFDYRHSDGFYLCPSCSVNLFSWEDLY